MTSEFPSRGPAGPAGPAGQRGPAGPAGETAHVDNATIDVSQAQIIESRASKQQARYLAYSMCVLFAFVIGGLLVSLLFTSSQVHRVQQISEQARQNAEAISDQNEILRKQITGDCGFYRDLSGLPVQNAANGHPSELGVKIISDSRAAWTGHGCPGKLPPPDPTFVRGAGYYRLPVN